MNRDIRARVRKLVSEHETRDPKRIADDLGIDVIYKSYSYRTKGYFINILGYSFIVVNDILNGVFCFVPFLQFLCKNSL